MKRKTGLIISMALILLLLAGAVTVSVIFSEKELPNHVELAAAEASELEFLFVSDLSVMTDAEIGDPYSEDFTAWAAEQTGAAFLSEAVFKTFLQEVENSGIKTLLVAGNLTANGSLASHNFVKSAFDGLRAKGISIYVVPGRNDISDDGYVYGFEDGVYQMVDAATKEDFAELYMFYGYSLANRQFGRKTLNFSASLNDKYTLIGLDNATMGRNDSFHLSVPSWLEYQLQTAKDNNKTPILLTHRPVADRFSSVTAITGSPIRDTVSPDIETLEGILTNGGLEYVFSGHLDVCDVRRVSTESGSYIDVMNTGINMYGSAYRHVRFTKNYADFSLVPMPEIDEQYLPSFLSEDDLASVKNGWKSFVFENFEEQLFNTITPLFDSIADLLLEHVFGINPERYSGDLTRLNAFIDDAVLSLVDMPIYEKDANGGKSIEGYAKKYNKSLPETDYENIPDLVLNVLIKGFYSRELSFTAESPEFDVLKYCLYAVFYNIFTPDGDNIFTIMDAYMSISVRNPDCEKFLTRLYEEDVLDLTADEMLMQLLKMDVLSKDSTISMLLNSFHSSQALLDTALAMVVDRGILGDFKFLKPYLEIIPKEERDPKYPLTYKGGIYFGRLYDEYVVEKIAMDVLVSNVSLSGNFVVLKSDLSSHQK